MAKQTKKIAALVATALIVLSLALVMFLRDTDDAPDEPLPTPPTSYPLISRTQAEITRIDIHHETQETFTLQRGVAFSDLFFWHIADEPDWFIDMLRVQEMIFVAFHLSAVEKIHDDTASINLAEFGLDPARTIFTAHYETGATASILLGDETPDRRHFFLMVEGDPAMYLVPHVVGARMQMDVGDLVSRFIFTTQAEFLSRFRVAQRGREPLEMAAMGDLDAFPTLQYVTPTVVAELEVSTFYLNRFLLDDLNNALRLGEVVAIAPDDLTPFGLHDPFIELFYSTLHERVHLLFGDAFMREVDGINVPYMYVMFADRPHVFVIDTTAVDLLTDLNAMQFMTRFIALVPIVDVERVTIMHPDGYFDIEINNIIETNDIAPTINGVPIPAPAFRILYRMIIALAADASIESHPATGTPVVTIQYHMSDGTQTVLELFNYDANFYVFSLDGEDAWAVTNRRSVDQLLAEANRLMSGG